MRVGSFIIQNDDEIQVIPSRVIEDVLPTLAGSQTEHFASGFRQRSNTANQLYLGTPAADILTSTNGRFLLTKASTADAKLPELWAYSDDSIHLLIQEIQRGTYRIVSDGHDYADDIREQLFIGEVEGAVRRGIDIQPQPIPGINTSFLDPRSRSFMTHALDYDRSLPYASYNWEIFFHVPFLVATQLSQNQQFAEAERWFHLVFDPTSSVEGNGPERFWRFLPFQQAGQGYAITDLLELLGRVAAGATLRGSPIFQQ